MYWDDENEIGERVWMGLEIESVEKALWMMTGVPWRECSWKTKPEQ
jgi:hypothetical protein